MIKTQPQLALRKDLRPDPNQPRKEFPEAVLAERRESIKANGITDALIVRADPEGKTKWMIVEGEIRWRCAGELKLERVPIVVREFADEAAVRAYQRIVGTQRTNLSDLERAASLAAELAARQKQAPKFSVTDLGAALGIPRATLYESFALLKCSAPVVAALKEGKIDASKARLFATVPVDQHKALLEEVIENDDNWDSDEPMSVREITEHIAEKYSRQLKDAPFDVKADYLVSVGDARNYKKGAGARTTLPHCAVCPQRSGNIEGMGGNPNVCTNVECFGQKTTSHTSLTLKKAEADGQRIVSAEEYERNSHKFEKADEKCYRDAKNRTYAQLAKAAGITPSVAVTRQGKAIEVFTPDDKGKILKANKLQSSYSGGGGDAAWRKKQAATKKKITAMQSALDAAAAGVLAKLVKGTALPEKLWVFLAQATYDRLGFPARHQKQMGNRKQWFAKATAADCAAYVVEELTLSSATDGEWNSSTWNSAALAVAKLAGVNLDKLRTASAKPTPAKMAKVAKKPKPAARQRAAKVSGSLPRTATKKGKK